MHSVLRKKTYLQECQMANAITQRYMHRNDGHMVTSEIFYNLSMFFYYEKYLSRKMPSPLAYFNTLIENKEKIQKVIVPLNQTVIYQNQSSLII